MLELIEDLGMMYPTEKSKNKTRFGIYKCPVCNNCFKTRTNDVKAGKTTKCKKCSSKKRGLLSLKHGKSKNNPLYRVWLTMRSRCNNSNVLSFKRYGGRGISVCKEWDSFIKFEEWSLVNGYQKGLTIDRINNDGNYEPSNCRWTDMSTQCYNRKNIPTSSGYKFIYKRNNKFEVIFQKKGKFEKVYEVFYSLEEALAFKDWWIKNKIKKEYEAL